MTTAFRKSIENQRSVYDSLAEPLLYQLAKVHKLSIREFAEIFGVSVNHAEAVLKHRIFPSLELAVRIARYYGVTVDELFGWRFDDNGERSPLILEVNGKLVRLKSKSKVLEVVTNGQDQVHGLRETGTAGIN